MTKFRPPTPHTPPPTSKKGPPLNRTLGDLLEWYWRDAHGVVHKTRPQATAPHLGMTVCQIDHRMEQTLALVTCLWCLSERSWWV